MNDDKVKLLFQQGDFELQYARKELCKPSGDVVSYSVCVNARSALYHFLRCLYILHARDNREEAQDSRTLEQLVDYCNRYDKKLQRIDFSSVYCRGRNVLKQDDEGFFYCNDVEKVKFCTNLADTVRGLVLDKGWTGLSAGM